MHEEYKRKEEKELIRRFEAFLKNKEVHYFDEDSYLQVVTYYQNQEKLGLALKACELAQEQYPFSMEIVMEKADVLIRLNRAKEAVAGLDSALNYHPKDPEIMIKLSPQHI